MWQCAHAECKESAVPNLSEGLLHIGELRKYFSLSSFGFNWQRGFFLTHRTTRFLRFPISLGMDPSTRLLCR